MPERKTSITITGNLILIPFVHNFKKKTIGFKFEANILVYVCIV